MRGGLKKVDQGGGTRSMVASNNKAQREKRAANITSEKQIVLGFRA